MRLLLLALPLAAFACGNIEPEPAAPAAPPPARPEPPRAPEASTAAPPPPSASAPEAGAPHSAATRADEAVPDWVLETTKPLRAKLDACYLAGLAKAPTMVGTVMISMGIDREGKVTTSPQASEEIPVPVVSCVVGLLAKAKFTPPKGAAPIFVALPVRFHNNPSDGPSVSIGKRDPGY